MSENIQKTSFFKRLSKFDLKIRFACYVILFSFFINISGLKSMESSICELVDTNNITHRITCVCKNMQNDQWNVGPNVTYALGGAALTFVLPKVWEWAKTKYTPIRNRLQQNYPDYFSWLW